MTNASVAIVALTSEGEHLARRLVGALSHAEVHGLEKRTSEPDVPFSNTIDHLRGLFEAGRPIIGICAAGILIRAVASELANKNEDPPVLAVAQDGSAVVPLLGGHHGANRMARLVSEALGISPSITTAGDVGFGFSLDDPPPGWRVGDKTPAKIVGAALLAGESVRIIADDDMPWPTGLDLPTTDDPSAPAIALTDKADAFDERTLVLHPQSLAVGIGCERGTGLDEIRAHFNRVMTEANLAKQSVACIVSIDLKADEEAILALADELNVPARFFDAETLETEAPRLQNPSDVVFAEVGCHGVAEGAALAAVGAAGELIVPKQKSTRATCAVARSHMPLRGDQIGTQRGRLSIVGIGPGQASWRTPEVTNWLTGVTDVVGYGLYLDLLGPLIEGKARHMSELSEEEARVRRSIELAAEGRDVALVSSGDAGIYAMAALAFEVLDRDNNPAFNRIEIRVSPGISAVQAAAARIGAPLGHDFALISLSDLLTPWEIIEKRIRAAAEGDFTVAFYNPVSKRRRTQLAAAKEILLRHRPDETPVILARNLGRETENVEIISLAELEVDMVDMLTLVLVGSSTTKRFAAGQREWAYTPRGYAKKMA